MFSIWQHSTLKICSLLATFFNTQQTFQHCLNVVVRVTWRQDVGQCQINFRKTLCMATLKFTTLENVESMFPISTLILTTLDNVETYFQLRVSQRWSTSKQRCAYDHFQKVEKRKKVFLSCRKKMTHLINNTFFPLWSIKKKGKHE